ncbi:MAG: acetate--CoA ligase family protein [Candidatus Aenigmarchaeota archaeon]|nr:acetate--CoA ligase family protein [Candidatus Aenigmarchaeota archaeon]
MKKFYAEYEAEKFLSKYMPVAKGFLCKDSKSIVAAAKNLGYPIVLKIISKQALHKTDIGGVVIVKNEGELFGAFNNLVGIAKKNKIKTEGILVQEFLQGKEVIIGIKKDATFGHVLAFGMGGKYVEILKDVTFRVCSITKEDAEQMIDELKFGKILFGARNEQPVNRNILVKTLIAVSNIPAKNKKIEELDINPFIVNDKMGKVADARIVFG